MSRTLLTKRDSMASSSKKRTTMAKHNRENAVRERRARKQAKKDARKQVAASGPGESIEPPNHVAREPDTEERRGWATGSHDLSRWDRHRARRLGRFVTSTRGSTSRPSARRAIVSRVAFASPASSLWMCRMCRPERQASASKVNPRYARRRARFFATRRQRSRSSFSSFFIGVPPRWRSRGRPSRAVARAR